MQPQTSFCQVNFSCKERYGLDRRKGLQLKLKRALTTGAPSSQLQAENGPKLERDKVLDLKRVCFSTRNEKRNRWRMCNARSSTQQYNVTLHYQREGKCRHAGMTKVFESTALMFEHLQGASASCLRRFRGLENASASHVYPVLLLREDV